MRFLILLYAIIYLSSCQNQTTGKSTIGQETATGAAQQKSPGNTYATIPVEESKKMMNSNPEIIFLDVRTPEETALGTIQNAMVIDLYDSEFTQKIEALDKSKTYIVYCAVGGRSVTACEKLNNAGFTSVYNLAGGYRAWTN